MYLGEFVEVKRRLEKRLRRQHRLLYSIFRQRVLCPVPFKLEVRRHLGDMESDGRRIPCRTALEDKSPAIELEKACTES